MRALLAFTLLLLTPLFADEYLYIIHAKSARYDAKSQTLLLQDIDHSVTYFSDSNPRRAGKQTLQAFLFGLVGEKKRFNAGFVYYGNLEKDYSDILLALSEPHYSFEKSELAFHVEVLEDQAYLPPKMEEVNLFVDDIPEEKR